MLRFLLGALAVGGVAAAASAADYSWSLGTSGNWADPARWSLGGVPGAADNATIAALGTYTVTMAGTQAAFNVTLDSANATVAASDFTLGGTLTLRAGTWVMGGLGGNPAIFTGGTVTRGAGGTGSFRVDGDVRFRDAAVQGDALAFTTSGALVRMAGAAAFTPGSVVSFSSTQVHGDLTGVVFEQNAVVNNVTFQTGANVRLGLSAGASLTLGPNAVVRHNDANATGIGVVGRHLFVSNANPFTLTNRGTILDVSGTLYVGKEFTTTNGDPGVTVVNSGLIESRFDTTIHATTFTNSPGGVVRATAGGGVFVFALGGWTNQGTFDVGGAGSTFTMGGRFLRSDIGTITRTGSNTVGFYAARLDNAGGTLALSAATGNYVLYGDQFTSGADVVGGSLSVSGGAKFEVRVYPGAYSGLDYAYLTDVAVGLGALDFEARGGKAFLRGTTAFAAGETVTLAGTDTQLAFAQTKQLDNVTVVLAGRDSSLAVVDNNALTLGPTATVRKTGPDTGSCAPSRSSPPPGRRR